ncbi:MAG: site-2 protease family protein [Planctomycetaceae bacterium]|jgi:Zn-dependent protease|nr:site-2 protease family protein [Planctomycetaceae bacterium]
MFGVPLQTPFDLRFVLFKIPISVTPFFWLIAFLFSSGGNHNLPMFIVIRMFAIFLSILVHEMGHAMVIRYIFGAQPYVILHGFGGLTFHDRPYYYRTPKSWGQILISFAGPAAGFLFSFVFWVIYAVFSDKVSTNEYLLILLGNFIIIGIIWGILNLMPVYPLDGGQISREICHLISPRHGIRVSLVISVVVAIALALLALKSGDTFLAILFGFLAYGSIQMLQTRQY